MSTSGKGKRVASVSSILRPSEHRCWVIGSAAVTSIELENELDEQTTKSSLIVSISSVEPIGLNTVALPIANVWSSSCFSTLDNSALCFTSSIGGDGDLTGSGSDFNDSVVSTASIWLLTWCLFIFRGDFRFTACCRIPWTNEETTMGKSCPCCRAISGCDLLKLVTICNNNWSKFGCCTNRFMPSEIVEAIHSRIVGSCTMRWMVCIDKSIITW